jgi:hypothetical protein
MRGVMSADGADADTSRARRRLDRPVLVSNVVSGAFWLFLMTPPWSDDFGGPELFLMGAAYVVAGSLFFAAVYAREALSVKQELVAWVAPWLVACVLWSDVLSGIDPEPGGGWAAAIAGAVGLGLLVGTPCYLAWQIVALVIRQLIAWRAGRSLLPSEPDESVAKRRSGARPGP